ncbi:MAG: helix-turn-helix transcriptional regulator [Clostridia bacterium]|nr:helix-turn-helix transcriptional regulator [Clostridia bacterium]
MQKTSSYVHLPVSLDPEFPIRAPKGDYLHSPLAYPECMHYHDALELGLCRRGSGIFYIGGGIHSFSAGDVSVIAPGVAHIAQSAGDDMSGWQFIDLVPADLLGPDCGALLAEAGRFSGILHPDSGVPDLVRRLIDAYLADRPFSRERVVWLTGLIMAELAARSAPKDAPSYESVSEVSAAVVYISMHYDEQLTVEQLAALCSRSVTSFRRCFERATGKAPFEYLYEVRVKAAVNLLRGSSMPASEIAGRVGYPTLSSFNRHFRRITGLTPSAMRKSAD